METPTLNALVKRFEEIYPGISLQPLRMEGNGILPRVSVEQRAGKYNVDVISADELPMKQLEDVGALQSARFPARDFIRGSVDPNGFWATLYYDTTVIAWNPQKVRADGLQPPASFADLAKPEWRGKIGIDATAFNWYAGVLATQPNGRELVAAIAANHPLMTGGHTETVAALGAGEFDASPTVYGYSVDHSQRQGVPVAFTNPRPLIMTPTTIAMAKNAPHAGAAQTFLDWILSLEGQQFIVDRSGRNVARLGVANNPRVFPPKHPVYILPPPDRAHYDSLVADFRSLFGIGA
jgi:iron(III) transport system substrate-binding protein